MWSQIHILSLNLLIYRGGDVEGELDAGEVLGRQVGRVSVLVDSTHQEHVTEIKSVNYKFIEIRRCIGRGGSVVG